MMPCMADGFFSIQGASHGTVGEIGLLPADVAISTTLATDKPCDSTPTIAFASFVFKPIKPRTPFLPNFSSTFCNLYGLYASAP